MPLPSLRSQSTVLRQRHRRRGLLEQHRYLVVRDSDIVIAGRHIREPQRNANNLVGTARYASINAHYGVCSRRDDIVSLGHTLIYVSPTVFFRDAVLPRSPASLSSPYLPLATDGDMGGVGMLCCRRAPRIHPCNCLLACHVVPLAGIHGCWLPSRFLPLMMAGMMLTSLLRSAPIAPQGVPPVARSAVPRNRHPQGQAQAAAEQEAVHPLGGPLRQ